MADLNVSMILRLVDRATTPIKGVIRQVGALGKAARDADMGRMAQRAGALRDAQRGAALEAAGLAYAMAKALQPAIEFESAMGDVKKVIDFTAKDGLARFGEDIRSLTRDIPLAATELASIAAAAGQANMVDAMLPDEEKRRQLKEFVTDAAHMAVAFDIGAREAGDSMAGLRTIFRLGQTEVVGLLDAVNLLGNKMDLQSKDLVNVLTRSGGVADTFGLTAEQASALGASLLALKLPPEIAADAMKVMLGNLATAESGTAKFKSSMKKLGLSVGEFSDMMRDDAQGALVEFLDLVADREDKLSIITDMFGIDQASKIVTLVNNLDQYRSALGHVGDKSNYAGGMVVEFAIKAAETAAKLELFKTAANDVAIVAGTVLLPALKDALDTVRPMVAQLSAWAEANPELVKSIVYITAALIGFKLVGAIGLWLFGGLASGTLKFLNALKWLLPILSGPILGAMATFSGALIALGRAAMTLFANPIGLAVAAVAAAVYLIYENWTPIKDWFKRLWGDVQTIFEGVGDILMGILTLDFGRVIDGLKGLFDGLLSYFTTIFAGIGGVITGTANTVLNAIGLGDAGLPNLANLPAPTLGNTGGNTGPHPRARGGPVGPGQTYLVGEEGPELLQFGASGFITPNDVLIDRRAPLAPRAGGVGAGGLSLTAPITINAAPGMDPAAIARAVRRELRAMMDGAGDMHDGAFQRGVA